MSHQHFQTVCQLIDDRAATAPDHRILLTPTPSSSSPDGFDLHHHTNLDLQLYSCALAREYQSQGLVPASEEGDSVIGILSKSGFHYIVNVLALIRLGWSVLYLSPNNGPLALANLFEKSAVKVVLYQDAYLRNAEDGNELLRKEGKGTPELRRVVEKERWERGEYLKPVREPSEREESRTAFIIHSSGSTGLPKPIFLNNRASLHNFSQNFNKSGLITLPLYHGHGHCTFFRAIHCQKQLCMYPSSMPITAPNLVKIMRLLHPQAFFAVPYVIKLMSEEEEGIEELKKCDIVTFGGAPCPDNVGDVLVGRGVNLVGHYGATEMGQLATSEREYASDNGWNWIRLTPKAEKCVRWERQPGEEEVYELVVEKTWPSLVRSTNEDGSYSSSDLFIRHPDHPNRFKYYGRKDDTLTLVNGEKVNPVLTELRLRESKYIKDAVVFGVGRSACGVLLFPAYEEFPSVLEEKGEAAIVEVLWPDVVRVNNGVESHAKIAKELVRIGARGAAVPRADKGTVLRGRVYKEFADVIEETYRKAEEGKEENLLVLDSKEAWTKFLFNLLNQVPSVQAFKGEITPEMDIFQLGVDSLQSVWIRNQIQKKVDLKGNRLGQNIVYEHPSIERLAQYLDAIVNGREAGKVENEDEKMVRLVAEFSDFEKVEGERKKVESHVVVLTGATGSLGAHILKTLVDSPQVKKVYCLTRARDDASALERTKASLQERGYDPSSVDLSKVSALASSLAKPDLGLSPEIYMEVQSTVTTIIDNAWSVNFNLSVESFKQDHIAGVYHLIKLALPSRASFFFCSSVSSTVGLKDTQVFEQHYSNTDAAQGMGYARSKWVAERITQAAGEKTGVRSGVLRIGQLVGDSKNGKWNTTEAISLIFKSADTLGVVPSFDERPNWLPVDWAAKIIVDLTLSDPELTGLAPVFHVVNPASASDRPSWDDILAFLKQAGLKFEVVDQWKWLDILSKSEPDFEKNPTKKLLDFFESKYGKREKRVDKAYETSKTREVSKASREVGVAVKELIGKFVESWRKEGFLKL
ncbi:L-aminoadipate-semialdehyde dehydrogenase [Atractiella rhizophila]|nr:L-aminoadipate-semialdehyde dehydrogenase [Atractiella rhizophila]